MAAATSAAATSTAATSAAQQQHQQLKQVTAAAAVGKSVKEKPQALRSPSSGISIEVKFLPCLRRV